MIKKILLAISLIAMQAQASDDCYTCSNPSQTIGPRGDVITEIKFDNGTTTKFLDCSKWSTHENKRIVSIKMRFPKTLDISEAFFDHVPASARACNLLQAIHAVDDSKYNFLLSTYVPTQTCQMKLQSTLLMDTNYSIGFYQATYNSVITVVNKTETPSCPNYIPRFLDMMVKSLNDLTKESVKDQLTRFGHESFQGALIQRDIHLAKIDNSPRKSRKAFKSFNAQIESLDQKKSLCLIRTAAPNKATAPSSEALPAMW